jgi:hypothetical protein
VKSSIWGKHLGVWPADHFHTINKRFVIELKDPTGDIAPYWVRALEQVMESVDRGATDSAVARQAQQA